MYYEPTTYAPVYYTEAPKWVPILFLFNYHLFLTRLPFPRYEAPSYATEASYYVEQIYPTESYYSAPSY